MINFFKNLYANFKIGRFDFYDRKCRITDKVVKDFITNEIISVEHSHGIYSNTTLETVSGFKMRIRSLDGSYSMGGAGEIYDNMGKRIYSWSSVRPSAYTMYVTKKVIDNATFNKYKKGFGKVNNIKKLIKKL